MIVLCPKCKGEMRFSEAWPCQLFREYYCQRCNWYSVVDIRELPDWDPTLYDEELLGIRHKDLYQEV